MAGHNEHKKKLIDRYGNPVGTPPELLFIDGKSIENSEKNYQEYDKMAYNAGENSHYDNYKPDFINGDSGNYKPFGDNKYYNQNIENAQNMQDESKKYDIMYAKGEDVFKNDIYLKKKEFYNQMHSGQQQRQYDGSEYSSQYFEDPQQEIFVDPKQYYDSFEYNYPYDGSGEQPLYVNMKQFNHIRRRKMRRDYLDGMMKANNKAGYLHESRHRHAMSRMRAPSGRFLTKEETAALNKKNQQADESEKQS